jgi:hypothetical protein
MNQDCKEIGQSNPSILRYSKVKSLCVGSVYAQRDFVKLRSLRLCTVSLFDNLAKLNFPLSWYTLREAAISEFMQSDQN